jgi:hypothetical protein
MKQMFAFIVVAFLAVPFASFAQSPWGSIENLGAYVPEDSIVVLSREETGEPGYVHEKYAFYCLGELRLVDYYGSALIRRTKMSSSLNA